jgi:hypothetical protein
MNTGDFTITTNQRRLDVSTIGSWFIEPWSPQLAREMRIGARAELQRAYAGGDDSFPGQLRELIATFWLGEPVEYRYQILKAQAVDGWRPLLELIYGQLLISRGLAPAMRHLDEGFLAASALLSPDDYFRVMRRHDLLRFIPLFQTPRPARTLDELISEARVIQQLTGGSLKNRNNGVRNGADIIG